MGGKLMSDKNVHQTSHQLVVLLIQAVLFAGLLYLATVLGLDRESFMGDVAMLIIAGTIAIIFVTFKPLAPGIIPNHMSMGAKQKGTLLSFSNNGENKKC